MLTLAGMLPAGHDAVVNNGLALFEIGSYLGWALLCKADQKDDSPRAALAACRSGLAPADVRPSAPGMI
jgi:hypothetical protein